MTGKMSSSLLSRLDRESRIRVLVFLLLLSSITTWSVGQRDPGKDSSDRQHPTSGTSIVRFAEVDDGIYRGSKPKTDADFRFLQSKHIRYILDLHFLPFLWRIEKNHAQKYGIAVVPALINASPLPPSEERVNHILCILGDKRFHPIYFHCDIGRDRTSLIAALYKVYFGGITQQAAWQEMKYFGFKDSWTLRGLKVYFERHAKRPCLTNLPLCARSQSKQ